MAKRKLSEGWESKGSATDSENEVLSGSSVGEDIGGSNEESGNDRSSEAEESSNGSDSMSEESVEVILDALPLRYMSPEGVILGGSGRGTQGVKGTLAGELGKGKAKVVEAVVKGTKGKTKMAEKVLEKRRKMGEDRGPAIPTKSCLGGAKGWMECNEKFVMTPPNARRNITSVLIAKRATTSLPSGLFRTKSWGRG